MPIVYNPHCEIWGQLLSLSVAAMFDDQTMCITIDVDGVVASARMRPGTRFAEVRRLLRTALEEQGQCYMTYEPQKKVNRLLTVGATDHETRQFREIDLRKEEEEQKG